ncbi:vWA domain-containing protein [Pseudonocardia yunnanensis]|uniref:VWA domain-containing protein n=1 Tax=Pseudonocardia yunnanensis TaxID=58107 RepID=A0ABW4FA49_9PSEU
MINPRPDVIRIAVVAAVAWLLVTMPAGVAHAQDGTGPAELAPTMLVLDASGSMTGADPAGGTKMDAAKKAVHALVDAAPDGAPVGLAVYGTGTGNSDAERARGCQDVTVLRPPGAIDKAALATAVDGVVPRGYTPIGRSLQVAAEQLPQEGPRSVVLVSDGEDTCAPPEPCDVVRTLAGQGVDLVVHAVGFGVDAVARAQLACVAQATGGTYTDAPDAGALQRVLPRVAATALRNYQPAGTPITGTPTFDAAPVAGPGQHLDTVGQHEQRYYAVDVPAGATAYFSATVSFPRLRGIDVVNDFNTLQLRTYGEDGADCHEFESEQASRSSDGAALTVATTWDGATKEDTGSSPTGDACKGGGRYWFALEWDRVSAGVPERLPVELLIGVEPAVTDPGPVAVLPLGAFVEPTGAPRPVVGGGSFNVAGTLDRSGSYTDVLQRGEFVFYRVRLDWGQGLAYRVRYAETPGRGLEHLSTVTTRVYTPTREEIDQDFNSYNGEARQLPSNGPAITTVPVRYGNRNADVVATRTQSVAGWYSISVQVGAPHTDTGIAAPVPIQLDLTVTGDPEPGPAYAFSSPEAQRIGPFGEPGTPAAAPVPAGPGSARGEAASTTVVSPAGWATIAGGAALVVAMAIGLVLRARRRTR